MGRVKCFDKKDRWGAFFFTLRTNSSGKREFVYYGEVCPEYFYSDEFEEYVDGWAVKLPNGNMNGVVFDWETIWEWNDFHYGFKREKRKINIVETRYVDPDEPYEIANKLVLGPDKIGSEQIYIVKYDTPDGNYCV